MAAKKFAGGTFARIMIKGMADEEISEHEELEFVPHQLWSRARVDIQKL